MTKPNERAGADAELGAAAALLTERPHEALAGARRLLAQQPGLIGAHLLAAAALRSMGDAAAAAKAEQEALRASMRQPAVAGAARALNERDAVAAERLLRPHLARQPDDPAALRMLAAVARAYGQFHDAHSMLSRALELAPSYEPARQELADVLTKLGRLEEGLREAETLLSAQPDFPTYLTLKANILDGMGRYDEAIGVYEHLLARFPDHHDLWIAYGNGLRTVGRLEESIGAYRRVIALDLGAGGAWWSLANLQTVPLGGEDIAAMTEALSVNGLSPDDRVGIHFALGKAFEDSRDWERSFRNYEAGNRLRRAQLSYDADETTALVRQSEAVFTPAFFAAREGQGCPDPDPIFVIGIQRSGSTLVEQILATHSQVEGTSELPDIPAIARGVGALKFGRAGSSYPAPLAGLGAADLAALGRDYLGRASGHRATAKPFFIDKLPNNWAHAGLIHLILPNAKIVDVRRHPLDSCFSNYKHLYRLEQRFTYDLTEMGRYYRDYVEMMRHIDRVLPGRVHRIVYERLVENTEGEVRRLLDYLGLPFEPACLRFFENKRAVRTPSSEQVRRPINRGGIGRWKPYEPWLQPLKDALGPVVAAYPDVPVA